MSGAAIGALGGIAGGISSGVQQGMKLGDQLNQRKAQQMAGGGLGALAQGQGAAPPNGGAQAPMPGQASQPAQQTQQQPQAPQAPQPPGAQPPQPPPQPAPQQAPPVSAAPTSPLKQAILGQESGNRDNVGTSVDNAHGPGQIIPATFRQYARPGENINDPAANRAVSARIVDDYAQKFGGDPARVAVAYFSGPGNVAPPGSPTPYKTDAKDGNGVSTSQYVQQVMGRMGQGGAQGGGQPQGGMPPSGAMSLKDAVSAIKKAYPNATDQQVFLAVQNMMPLMHNEAQDQYKQMALALQSERVGLQGQHNEDTFQLGKQRLEQADAKMAQQDQQFHEREERLQKGLTERVRRDTAQIENSQARLDVLRQRAAQSKSMDEFKQRKAEYDEARKDVEDKMKWAGDSAKELTSAEKGSTPEVKQLRALSEKQQQAADQAEKEFADKQKEFQSGSSKGGAPKVGDVVDGYRYKGGDPADQKSWEKV